MGASLFCHGICVCENLLLLNLSNVRRSAKLL
ncbi:hypothetical protein ACJIZ3_014603 [Penstemon smallii]|uniref:Uncharacterized protein n=1 Tax=Penstemon smallii TaxID=265156 RepID=A0ABD3RK19_9LAMI